MTNTTTTTRPAIRYVLVVTRLADTITSQYEAFVRRSIVAGVDGPCTDVEVVDCYTDYATRKGFTITGWPTIRTDAWGTEVAEFPVVPIATR